MAITPSTNTDAVTRRIVLLMGWGGAAAFTLLLALACLRPVLIESWARQAITAEVRERIASQTPEHGWTRAAARLALRKGKTITEGAASHGALPAAARALIERKYADRVQGLVRELRIFSAANALVFLALGLLACYWPGQQLLAPAAVLLGAALLVGCTYVFKQDWLHTILLGDYVGLWYFSYLLVAIAFMLDVLFNRARTSLALVIVGLSVVGAFLSAVGS